MAGSLTTGISSPPDREKLVADVLWQDEQGLEQVLEINQESEELRIEIYPRRSREPWVFSYDEFVATLERARKRLVER